MSMKLILLFSLCGLFVSTSVSYAGSCCTASKTTTPRSTTDYYIFEWTEGEKPTLPLWIPEA